MLSFEEIQELLHGMLPFEMDEGEADELYLGSSTIEFRSKGEHLFLPGDPPKGFYWILKGGVRIGPPRDTALILRAGDFVGFDNFLLQQKHTVTVSSSTEYVKTLFIDSKCYMSIFSKNDNLMMFALRQHLSLFLTLKAL